MKNGVIAFLTGVLFSVGLVVGGMTQPGKVIAFLDLFGSWDPSLAFVMGGAILVYLPAYRIITRRKTPLFSARFLVPERKDLDARLIGGAALFGIGWGLGGFCPGPGLTSAGSLAPAGLVFAASMVGGFLLHRAWDLAARRRAARLAATQPASGRMP